MSPAVVLTRTVPFVEVTAVVPPSPSPVRSKSSRLSACELTRNRPLPEILASREFTVVSSKFASLAVPSEPPGTSLATPSPLFVTSRNPSAVMLFVILGADASKIPPAEFRNVSPPVLRFEPESIRATLMSLFAPPEVRTMSFASASVFDESTSVAKIEPLVVSTRIEPSAVSTSSRSILSDSRMLMSKSPVPAVVTEASSWAI